MTDFNIINLMEKFDLFSEQWNPKLIAEVNDMAVKIARIQGEFIWHHHEQEDELFYVLKGNLKIELRDRNLRLAPGELVVIPRGVDHRPVANEECFILMLEPKETLNTGNIQDNHTINKIEKL